MAGDKLFPFVTTDVALFTLDGDALRVLVVKRTNEPERGRWALPGGALKPSLDEDLAASARRVLAEKVRFDIPYLEQVCAFSGRDRDSRGWSISVLFYALLPKDRIDAVAGHKTEAIEWVDPDRPGRELAFDHDRQLAEALAQLRAKIEHDATALPKGHHRLIHARHHRRHPDVEAQDADAPLGVVATLRLDPHDECAGNIWPRDRAGDS